MLVTILIVISILALLGSGYGYRSGNNALAGGRRGLLWNFPCFGSHNL
jgi:hypothetical protein